jgi:two-component system nitrate/nitrite response regulator NarL
MTTPTTETVYAEPLTMRERQVAAAIARGLRNKQIAEELGISAETVKRHLASIYSKLAVRGRVALAIHVLRSHAA